MMFIVPLQSRKFGDPSCLMGIVMMMSDGDRDDHFLSDKIWDWSFWSKFRVCLLA